MDSVARKAFGQECEDQACLYLQSQGLTLIAKNYTEKTGEIDLIMRDKQDIVFIEVRSKHRTDFGNALDSITPAKVQKIITTAKLFLQKKHLFYKVNSRFDIVVIQPMDGKMQLEWLKNAFQVDRF